MVCGGLSFNWAAESWVEPLQQLIMCEFPELTPEKQEVMQPLGYSFYFISQLRWFLTSYK